MEPLEIRMMAKRRYGKIPLDQITILNSRKRSKDLFEKNIQSIKDVGLLKPIVVNERNYPKTHLYELVCGEGRFIAYKKLNQPEIPAEIINCDRKQALLFSLVENIARVPPGTMWFAYEVKRMHDTGFSIDQLCKITGNPDTYIRDYIRLVEQGEERLIRGVDNGLFSMSFARLVARSDNASIQNILMDAFDKGVVNSSNFVTVRNIITARMNRGKRTSRKPSNPKSQSSEYSVKQLKVDITKITEEKESFVNETALKENRLLSLLDELNNLLKQDEFTELVTAEGLGPIPQLKGNYNV